jgi:hypothetical protein
MFMAGHESTANTLTWAIYELARNPEYQTLVRAEIKAAREQAATRGDHDHLISDLDSMKYLLSLVKVHPFQIFIFHPELRGIFPRKPCDSIPLFHPSNGSHHGMMIFLCLRL